MIQKNLGRVNGFKINVIEGVRGRGKQLAYSDGSGRKICHCLNLGKHSWTRVRGGGDGE